MAEEKVNYESYIRPEETPPVDPKVGGPDERFFIRTHQAFEIWFAQCIDELESARGLLDRENVPEEDIPLITSRIHRVTATLNLLVNHFPVLETLETRSFFDFRRQLFGGTGQQSYRFREVEWLIGLPPLSADLASYLKERCDAYLMPVEKDEELIAARAYPVFYENVLRKNAEGKATVSSLDSRFADIAVKGTLRSHLLRWLSRTPFPNATRPDDLNPEHSATFRKKFRAAFEAAYRDDWKMLIDRKLQHEQDITPHADNAVKKLDWFLSAPERCSVLFILQFAERPLLTWPATLLEAVLEMDQALANWRNRHIAMVSRVLGGGRISTAGKSESGLPYLRSTLALRAFPELWDARSFLLGHDEVRSVYDADLLKRYGFGYAAAGS